MTRPALELADIVRQHGEAYRRSHTPPRDQLRALRAIEVCRTAALGGHVERCGQCSQQRISYNSCRNRHCPKCQNSERAEWLAKRKQDLLPVEYFHVVFTVPEPVAAMALQNKKAVYDILFRAASETLLRIASDRRHLGAALGFFAILHTWGQNLLHHPHLHCVVPGGGPSPDGQRWVGCRSGFFLPVRVLSRLFRRLFLAKLARVFVKDKLRFFGRLEHLNERRRFQLELAGLRKLEWVVYAKPPFGGPAQAIEYLGRYTHRVALSNDRIVALDNRNVTFRWKDYRGGGQHNIRLMTLSGEEFLRRFLLHILPRGFQRIRHCGFLANRCRKQQLTLCRNLLSNGASELLPRPEQCRAAREAITAPCAARCRECGGVMIRVHSFAAYRWPLRPPDTS